MFTREKWFLKQKAALIFRWKGFNQEFHFFIILRVAAAKLDDKQFTNIFNDVHLKPSTKVYIKRLYYVAF